MRVMVLHAHPLETSYNRALCNAVMETLQAKGHHADLVPERAHRQHVALGERLREELPERAHVWRDV